MSRITMFVLCVFLPLVALAAIATPAPVRAAYIKLAYDASLQETPQDAGFSLAMLPAGVVVTTTGDPVDGYYPVTAGGKSGWVRGDALALDAADSAAPEAAATTPAPDPTVPDEPVAEVPGPVEPVAEEPAPVEPAIDDLAIAEPVAGATPVADSALLAPVPAAPVVDGASLADPATQNSTDAAPTAEVASLTPPLDPNAPSVTVPDPGPVGPAAVAVEAEIFAGPGPEYGVLGMAAAGALVEQTGHAVGGYVTVRYVDVTGWVPLDHLGPAPATANS